MIQTTIFGMRLKIERIFTWEYGHRGVLSDHDFNSIKGKDTECQVPFRLTLVYNGRFVLGSFVKMACIDTVVSI